MWLINHARCLNMHEIVVLLTDRDRENMHDFPSWPVVPHCKRQHSAFDWVPESCRRRWESLRNTCSRWNSLWGIKPPTWGSLCFLWMCRLNMSWGASRWLIGHLFLLQVWPWPLLGSRTPSSIFTSAKCAGPSSVPTAISTTVPRSLHLPVCCQRSSSTLPSHSFYVVSYN